MPEMTHNTVLQLQFCDMIEPAICTTCNSRITSIMHCCEFIYGIRNPHSRNVYKERVVEQNSSSYRHLLNTLLEADIQLLDVFKTNMCGTNVYDVVAVDEEEEYEHYIDSLYYEDEDESDIGDEYVY